MEKYTSQKFYELMTDSTCAWFAHERAAEAAIADRDEEEDEILGSQFIPWA